MPEFTAVRPGGRRNLWLRPPALVTLGFLLSILIGTVLLGSPKAVVAGRAPLSPNEALFSATSATCVTGLTVVGTAADLSRYGQLIVLILLQIGGIGILSLSILVYTGLTARTGTTSGELLEGRLGGGALRGGPRTTFLLVVGGTFSVELLGALALRPALRGADATWWHAVFLSVSSFCNAGFDNLDAGLAPYAGSWAVGLPLLVLWLLGGLGFLIPVAVIARLRAGRSRTLDLNAAMILKGTALLMTAGALVFFACEAFGGLLSGRPLHEQLLLALFQGNTTRTAGFSMLDLASAQRVTLLALIPFMLIGGAPGSTAGGIKITAAWIFVAMLWNRMQGGQRLIIARRTIPLRFIRRSILITVLMIGMFGLLTLLLALLDRRHAFSLEALAFESASALGTVGLSTGITPELAPAAQGLLVAAMLFGRLGPLTAVYLLVPEITHSERVLYPRADVYVG